MVEQESSETEGSISESLNTSLRTVCLCAVSSLNEETLSQEQQSSSQSKVQPNKHSRKLQVQVHCSILEDTAALKLLWSASALQHSVCFNSAVACWFHSSSFCVCVWDSESAEANATDSSSILFYSSSLPTQPLSLLPSLLSICQVPPTPLLSSSHVSSFCSSQSLKINMWEVNLCVGGF